jgi:type III secretion inner rod protein HrpB2
MTVPIPPVTFAAPSLEQALPQGSHLQALSQRFDQLLAQTPPVAEPAVPAQGGQTLAGKTFEALDRSYEQMLMDGNYLLEHGSGMDLQSFTALSTSLTLKTAATTAYLTVGSSVVQSGKSTMNTLMKNQ